MAQTTIFTDDLTGETGAETLTFSFDGKTYTIDLAGSSKKALADALKPYIAKAQEIRNTYTPSVGKAKPKSASKPSDVDAAEVRKWADFHNIPTPSGGKWVGAKGKLSNEIKTKYLERKGDNG